MSAKRDPAIVTGRPGAYLDRGYERLRLIRALAIGGKSQAQLAREFGVAQSTICEFGKRYADKVEEVAADLENEFAGLWIAEKRARISELESQAELLRKLIHDEMTCERQTLFTAEGQAVLSRPDSEAIARLTRRYEATMRAVAEELGQLPSRTAIVLGGEQGNYKINGVDIEKMK